jgi:hypothetical protein
VSVHQRSTSIWLMSSCWTPSPPPRCSAFDHRTTQSRRSLSSAQYAGACLISRGPIANVAKAVRYWPIQPKRVGSADCMAVVSLVISAKRLGITSPPRGVPSNDRTNGRNSERILSTAQACMRWCWRRSGRAGGTRFLEMCDRSTLLRLLSFVALHPPCISRSCLEACFPILTIRATSGYEHCCAHSSGICKQH